MKTLAIYLMCGAATPKLAEAAVEGGADIVELGFPFSDPLADGPVIRRAGERALDEGMAAAEAGANSLIVADLPVDAEPGLRRVQLVAPTSTDERIALAAERTDGWLYLVTVTGTTGARGDLSPALRTLVGRARDLTGLPLYAGFGISTPEQAAAAAAIADGVVVGSRAVEVAADGPAALREYVASLREAVDSAPLVSS